jgi:hypothetical protein
MVAPLMDAPLASVTVPFSCAAAPPPWENVELAQTRKTANANATARAKRFLITHLFKANCSNSRRRRPPNRVATATFGAGSAAKTYVRCATYYGLSNHVNINLYAFMVQIQWPLTKYAIAAFYNFICVYNTVDSR